MHTKEKRDKLRKRISDVDNAFIKIKLPFPKDTILEKKLVDFSEHGASFLMSRDEGYLLPKTPLDHLKIKYNGKEIERKSAEVIYAARFASDFDFFRIGIRFIHDGLENKNQYIFTTRPERYEDDFFGNLDKFVSFKDESGTEYLCDILNISRYGLAFSIHKDSIVFRTSSVIENFRVIINNEMIFDGKIVIARITENNGNYIIGGEFAEDIFDIEHVIKIRETADIKTDINNFVQSLLPLEKINEQFKQKVADVEYILSKVKIFLDGEENRIADFSPVDKEHISRLVLEDIAVKTYPKINSLVKEIDNVSLNFNDKQIHEIYKEYYQSHLHQYIMLGPFPYRVWKKPLGYAGDYEMMNMLYRNDYEGSTLFSKYMHKYICQITPAQTNRNRVAYLTKKIQEAAQEVNGKHRRKVKIMTIGCGPAIELQRFVEMDSNSNNAEVTLIDFDEKALSHAKEKLLELKAKHVRSIKIKAQLVSIIQIIKGHKRGKEVFEKQDLIYCAGLFEYLHTSTCQALIDLCFQSLNENGQIIIGNFDEAANYRNLMEYGGEWYLIYRNEKSMIDMAAKVKNAINVYVEKEETGLNDFLLIKK